MSRLLEILGRAITVDTADLIWHWVDDVRHRKGNSKSPPAKQLDEILEYVDDRKLDAAEEQLRLYLFDNPSCVFGRLVAAALFVQKNQLHNAIEELNSVYMRQPNNTMALYALGHCYERLGKESEAVEFYQDCLKFKKYLQLPAQRLAAIYFKNGQLEKTIEQYELLRSEYPDDISTLVTLGHLYIVSAKYSQAIETFDTAILIHPDNFHSEDDIIDELIREGQLREALEQLDDLLQDYSDRLDLIIKRADILSMLGSTGEAVWQYEEAIRICPDSLEASIKLGTQYLHLHDEQLAAQQFNRGVEINDKIVDAYIGLSTSQKLAGNITDALLTLSLASAIQPNSLVLFAEAAMLRFRKQVGGNVKFHDLYNSADLIETVIRAHQEHISHEPLNPDVHYRLGLLFMSIGRLSNALESFCTTLEINPTYHRAIGKKLLCHLEMGEKQLALQELIIPHYDKKTLDLHYKTALLYCDRQKFSRSVFNLDRCFKDKFLFLDASVNISVVLQNLGLLDKAKALWYSLSQTANQTLNP